MTYFAAFTDLTPTVTFVISLWTLAALVAAFTVGMFNRFRKNMATDTQMIVQKELLPTAKSLEAMKKQMENFSEGLHAATELSMKHEGDLSGKDGLFSRVAHIEGPSASSELSRQGRFTTEITYDYFEHESLLHLRRSLLSRIAGTRTGSAGSEA